MATSTLKLYRKLKTLPLGGCAFNLAVSLKAPFFRTIRPNIVELEPSRCKIQIKDRWGVRNHIGTVNAVAMCTAAELAGGLALDVTIPPELRWIPKGMTVSYLKKAKGTLECTCELNDALIQEGDITVPVVIRNAGKEDVFSADITMHVSRKKA